MKTGRGFASDNNSGILPEILKAISEANVKHAAAYGEDPWTRKAEEAFEHYFGDGIAVYFVFNGTAANVLSLASCTQSYEAVLCSEMAHIYEDECGAPEFITGCKLIPVEPIQGKLTPEKLLPKIKGTGNQHHVQPKVISISQSTEFGTVYEPAELLALSRIAKENGLYFHMDGARISNAAVSLGLTFREFTREVGVDVLSFGGTKAGLLGAEAVVFFNEHLANHFKFRRKQSMQLASKMRFVSVQLEAFLTQELWLKSAQHSNQMAKYLKEKIRSMKKLEIAYPVDANGVFAWVPKSILASLQEQFPFYVWQNGEEKDLVRWMMSFDTTQEDIDSFCQLLESKLVSA